MGRYNRQARRKMRKSPALVQALVMTRWKQQSTSSARRCKPNASSRR